MVRKGSRSSASTPSTSRDSFNKQKTLIGGDADTIMILLKNLAATTSAVVARLDRLEGAHFDARGPADLGAIGSTTIETPESIIKVCSSAQVSSSTGSSNAGDFTCRPRSANRLHLQLQLNPRRRPLSISSTPPPAARLFNCLNMERLILTVGLWRWWTKTMTLAASSAVPSRLLLVTTRRRSSKFRHLFVGAQFGCGFEMSVDLKMFTSSSPKFYAV